MSRSPLNANIDIENQLETPIVPAAQTLSHSTTRWLPRPNFPNFWTENKSNFDPPQYGDTSATYWKLYASEAEIYDENFVNTLKGNTESMVFLNTLFSAIVAAFIIEIYKTLLPSNGQNVVDIPPSAAVRINIVLFSASS